jgi:hypothetical protein
MDGGSGLESFCEDHVELVFLSSLGGHLHLRKCNMVSLLYTNEGNH